MPKKPHPTALDELFNIAAADPKLADRLRALGYEVKTAAPVQRDIDHSERVSPEAPFQDMQPAQADATPIYPIPTAVSDGVGAPDSLSRGDVDVAPFRGASGTAIAMAQLPHTTEVPAAPTLSAPSATPADRKPIEWGYVAPAKGKAPGGRPRKVAPWYQAVAYEMRDGTSVRVALRRCGVTLTEREIKSLYRSKAFRQLYRRERREFLRQWGRKRIRPGAKLMDFYRGPR